MASETKCTCNSHNVESDKSLLLNLYTKVPIRLHLLIDCLKLSLRSYSPSFRKHHLGLKVTTSNYVAIDYNSDSFI